MSGLGVCAPNGRAMRGARHALLLLSHGTLTREYVLQELRWCVAAVAAAAAADRVAKSVSDGLFPPMQRAISLPARHDR